MIITNEDLKNRYEQLDSSELISLKSQGTLTDQATRVLTEILKNRNVSSEYIGKMQKLEEKEKQSINDFYENLAPRSIRLYAKLIDLSVASIPLIIVMNTGNEHLSGFATLFIVITILVSDCVVGQSIGKRITNIVIVNQNTMKPCTFTKSIFRNVVLIILTKIDLLFIFGRSRNRLGDIFAGTLVIKKAN